jgi:uncharacterized protein (TIGR03435 family)
MTRTSLLAALTISLAASVASLAQPPAAAPAFEVASIKPAPPLDPAKIMSGKMHVGMNIDAARVDIGSLSLQDLIMVAYKIKPYQLTGPDWMKVQRFDIMAKMPEGANKDQVPQMLQALLADRFKLAIHRDTKDHSVYALVVGKNGVKMKESAPEPGPAPAAAAGDSNAEPPGSGGTVMGRGENQVRMKPNPDGKGMTMTNKQFGEMKMSMGEAGMMRMEFSKMTMKVLADMVSRFVDRPVLDMTELKGGYQVALDLSMDEMQTMARAAAADAGIMMPGPPAKPEANRAPGDAASAPSTSVFAAIQKLGLKLDPRKAPVETIVVDHAEKMPTDN